MKKWTSYTIAFVLIFFIGDRLLAKLFADLVLTSEINFSMVYKGKQANNVVFLGNSRSEHSFCPPDIKKRIALNTFQLGYKGLSTQLSEVFWQDYLELNQKPNILVMEISNIASDNQSIYDLKAYSYWSTRMGQLLKKIDNKAYYATKLSHLFLWNGEILFNALYFMNRSDQNKCLHLTRYIKADTASTIAKKNTQSFIIKKDNLDSLKRIIKHSQQLDIKIILVFPPLHPEFIKYKKSNIQNFITTIQKEIGDKVRIIDYSDSIVNYKAFRDLNHLNNLGSNLLLDKMLIDGIFTSN